MKLNRYLCMLGVLMAGLTRSIPSHADEPEPESLLKGNKASEGNTDVADSGFEMPYHATRETKDATEFVISAGGLASAGNSSSIAATAAVRVRTPSLPNACSRCARTVPGLISSDAAISRFVRP